MNNNLVYSDLGINPLVTSSLLVSTVFPDIQIEVAYDKSTTSLLFSLKYRNLEVDYRIGENLGVDKDTYDLFIQALDNIFNSITSKALKEFNTKFFNYFKQQSVDKQLMAQISLEMSKILKVILSQEEETMFESLYSVTSVIN